MLIPETLLDAAGYPESPASGHGGSRLDIAVIFTSVKATLAAIRKAGALARSLSARIVLVVPQIVPWPLPLDRSPVLADFSEKRFRDIARESPVDIMVRLYLCRDRREALVAGLKPRSLVVVGGRKRWWPTSEKRQAKLLRRAGHEVIFIETD